MNAVIRNKFFGVNDVLFVVRDEWRVPALSVVPDLVGFSREDLNFVEYWFEFLRLCAWFSSKNTKRVTTRADNRHRVTGRSFPA